MPDPIPLPVRAERCETCRFWDLWEGESEYGACRRNAPRPLPWNNGKPGGFDGDYAGASEASWPVTTETDWCGEWRAADPVADQTAWVAFLSRLPSRVRTILGAAGVRSFADMSLKSEDDLLALPNCGCSTLNTIKAELRRAGHALRPS